MTLRRTYVVVPALNRLVRCWEINCCEINQGGIEKVLPELPN